MIETESRARGPEKPSRKGTKAMKTTLHGMPYASAERGKDVANELEAISYAVRILSPGQHLCVWEGDPSAPDAVLFARYACSEEFGVTQINA